MKVRTLTHRTRPITAAPDHFLPEVEEAAPPAAHRLGSIGRTASVRNPARQDGGDSDRSVRLEGAASDQERHEVLPAAAANGAVATSAAIAAWSAGGLRRSMGPNDASFSP